MWSPTHVQVTVQKARGLLTKGKNGTNDAFVTIGLGKEKYQTSVKEKAPDTVEWHEKCELQIPKQGNTAEITLTALHHNFLGVDEFLGYISIPLAGLDVYDRPKNRWYTLKDKPGKDKKKSRGELEVKVAFIVKAGSLADLSKKEKHRSSLGQVSQAFSSSLISISSLDKRKGLKKLASKIGHKIGKSKNKEKVHDDSENSGHLNESQLSLDNKHQPSQQKAGDADPGVISEGESEDDFTLDDLSHKGSGCSLEMGESNSSPLQQSLKNLADHNYYSHSDNMVVPPSKPPRTIIPTENKFDEWEQKLYGRHGKDGSNISPANTLKRRLNGMGTLVASASEDKISSVVSPYLNDAEGDNYTITNAPKSEPTYSPQRMRHPVFLDNYVKEDHHNTDVRSSPTLSTSSKIPLERIIIGGEMERIFPQPTNGSRLSTEVIKKYEGKTREDLIEMVVDLQAQLFIQSRQQKDLEDYLDNLLLRVMETSPRILQNPYKKKS